jgi:hypothetical protein
MTLLVLLLVQQVQLNQSGRKTQLVLLLVQLDLEYLLVLYFLEYLVVQLTHVTQYFLVILLHPFYLVVQLALEFLEYLVVQLFLHILGYLVVQIHLLLLEYLERLEFHVVQLVQFHQT